MPRKAPGNRRLSFMDPLVLAIMADEKDVTRRMTDPRLKAGDIVDVCEALVPGPRQTSGFDVVLYRADRATRFDYEQPERMRWLWKVRVLPARYCPGWAVRTRVEVVSVRQELLTAITDDDARREGIARMGHEPTAVTFCTVFRALHGLPVDADPSPFRIEFRRVAA